MLDHLDVSDDGRIIVAADWYVLYAFELGQKGPIWRIGSDAEPLETSEVALGRDGSRICIQSIFRVDAPLSEAVMFNCFATKEFFG